MAISDKARMERDMAYRSARENIAKILNVIDEITVNGKSEASACAKYNINMEKFRRIVRTDISCNDMPDDVKKYNKLSENIDNMSDEAVFLYSIFGEEIYPCDDFYQCLNIATKDFTNNEKYVIRHKFFERESFREIAEQLNLSGARISQILYKAMRKLKHPSRSKYFKLGLDGVKLTEEYKRKSLELDNRLKQIEGLKAKIKYLDATITNTNREIDRLNNVIHRQNLDIDGITKKVKDKLKSEDLDYGGTPIEELDLSVRAYNSLKLAGINTLGEMAIRSISDYKKIRNLGEKTLNEIIEKLRSLSIELEDE